MVMQVELMRALLTAEMDKAAIYGGPGERSTPLVGTQTLQSSVMPGLMPLTRKKLASGSSFRVKRPRNPADGIRPEAERFGEAWLHQLWNTTPAGLGRSVCGCS